MLSSLPFSSVHQWHTKRVTHPTPPQLAQYTGPHGRNLVSNSWHYLYRLARRRAQGGTQVTRKATRTNVSQEIRPRTRLKRTASPTITHSLFHNNVMQPAYNVSGKCTRTGVVTLPHRCTCSFLLFTRHGPGPYPVLSILSPKSPAPSVTTNSSVHASVPLCQM